jgi:hypothetical protein
MQVTRNSTSSGCDWSPRTQHFLNQKISFGHMKDLIWSIHYAKKEKKKNKTKGKKKTKEIGMCFLPYYMDMILCLRLLLHLNGSRSLF